MNVNTEALSDNPPVVARFFIFFSAVERSETFVYKRVKREPVIIEQGQDFKDTVSEKVKNIFDNYQVEWLMLSPNPNIPDTKSLFFESEVLNLSNDVVTSVNNLNTDLVNLRSEVEALKEASNPEDNG